MVFAWSQIARVHTTSYFRCITRSCSSLTSIQKVEQFLTGGATSLIIDVRSPSEYSYGHLPRAVNIPLFTDEERHIIGKTYKENGKQKAVEQGLKIVGPNLYNYVKQAKDHVKKQGTSGPIHIYCARGGMRSNSMSWLFNTACISAVTLPGGYKAFRQWVLHTLSLPRSFIVLGGMTGAGKTKILQELENQGEQIINLEREANHKGSAFGAINMEPQPSQEAFENSIAIKIASFDLSKHVWVEDESSNIGSVALPLAIKTQMLSSTTPVLYVERPVSERLANLYVDYGTAEKTKLIESTRKLEKRLGAERTKDIITLIEQGNISAAMTDVLKYYDKTYEHSTGRHAGQIITRVTAEGMDAAGWATFLRKQIQIMSKKDIQNTQTTDTQESQTTENKIQQIQTSKNNIKQQQKTYSTIMQNT